MFVSRLFRKSFALRSGVLVAAALAMALAMLPVESAFAQSAQISGTVVDAITNKPLPSASVVVEGTSLGSSTAVNGRFTIVGVQPGEYTVRATMVGYEEATVRVSAAASQTKNVYFRLEETWLQIPEIVVERAMLTGGFKGIESMPGSAHFIAPAQLEKFSYADVSRVLRSVPGVNVQEEDGYGLRPNIGLRGTGSERSSKITVMEDGVLIAPAPYAAPAAYYFPSIGRMEAVEVRKGSSQIKFGPYTTGGAINLVSTRIPTELTGRLDLLAGTDDNRTVLASIGKSYKHVGFLLETYQTRADGFKKLDGGGPTGFDKKDYLAKVRFATGPGARVYQALTLKAGYVKETSDETYLGLTDADFAATPDRRYAGSQRDVMHADQSQFVASHVVRPARWLDVKTTAYRTDFSRNWYKLDKVRAGTESQSVDIGDVLQHPEEYADELEVLGGAGSSDADALDVKANNRSYYAMGVQSSATLSFATPALRHDVEAGVRVHRDQIDRFQWVDKYAMVDGVMELTTAGIPGTESNRVEQADAVAAFLQYRMSMGRLSVQPGIRYERVKIERDEYGRSDPDRTGVELRTRSNTVDAVIPGIGVDYHLGGGLHGFAGVHKGFGPPGSQEGARPESSLAYESGVRLLRGLTFFEAVFFYNDYDNLLGADLAASGGQGTADQFNGGEVRVLGVEVSGTYDLGRFTRRGYSIPLGITYTRTTTEFLSSFESEFEAWGTVTKGDELPYVPPHQLGVSIGFETSQFAIDVSGKYTSRMRTVAGSGRIGAESSTDAHAIIDLAGSYRINSRVSVFGSILNVTDTEYIAARRPAGVRPGLPRHVRLGLKTRF